MQPDSRTTFLLGVAQKIARRANLAEARIEHLLSPLLTAPDLPAIPQFIGVDIDGLLSACRDTLTHGPQVNATSQDPPFDKTIQSVLQRAQNEVPRNGASEVTLTILFFSALCEIRDNPALKSLRKGARIRKHIPSMAADERPSVFQWLGGAVALACMMSGSMIGVWGGQRGETGDYLFADGALREATGALVATLAGPILARRGGLLDYAFGYRHLQFAAWWIFSVLVLIVIPVLMSFVLYHPGAFDQIAADLGISGFRMITTAGDWGKALAAIGALLGINAALLAFDKAPSGQATLQKVLTSLAAAAVALSLLSDRLGF